MSQRFFRSTEATYEHVRATLDFTWGHGPASGTLTCFEPAATAPRDAQGRVLLAVLSGFCQYEAVAGMLPQLLAINAVEEITETEYMAALQQATP